MTDPTAMTGTLETTGTGGGLNESLTHVATIFQDEAVALAADNEGPGSEAREEGPQSTLGTDAKPGPAAELSAQPASEGSSQEAPAAETAPAKKTATRSAARARKPAAGSADTTSE